MNNGRKEAEDIKAAKQFIVQRNKEREKRKEKKAVDRMKNNFPGINRLKELGSKMRGDGITTERLTMMPYGTRDTLLGQARSGNPNLAATLHNKGMFKEKDAILSGDLITLISMNNNKHTQHNQLLEKDTENNDYEDIRAEQSEKIISREDPASRSGRVTKLSRKLYSSSHQKSGVSKSLPGDHESVPVIPEIPDGQRTKSGKCPVPLSHVEKALVHRKSKDQSVSLESRTKIEDLVSGAWRQESYSKKPVQLYRDPKETNIDIQEFPLNLTNSKQSQEIPLDFSKSSTEYKPTARFGDDSIKDKDKIKLGATATESLIGNAADTEKKEQNYRSIFDCSFERTDYEDNVDNDKDIKSKDKTNELRKDDKKSEKHVQQTIHDSKLNAKTRNTILDDLNSTLAQCQISRKSESRMKSDSRRQRRVPPPERYVNLPGDKKIQKRVRGSTFKDRNFLDYMKHRPSSSKKPQSSKFQPFSSKMNQMEYRDPFKLDTAPVVGKIPNHYSSSKQDNCSRSDSALRSGRRNTYLNMMELNSDTYDHGRRRQEKVKSAKDDLLPLYQKNKETRDLKFLTSTPKRIYQDENTSPQYGKQKDTSMDFEQAFMEVGKVRLDSKSCSNRNIDNFKESPEIEGTNSSLRKENGHEFDENLRLQHQYIESQDHHLKSQDHHLKSQDQHLKSQDHHLNSQDQYQKTQGQYQTQYMYYHPSQHPSSFQQYNLQYAPYQQAVSQNQLNGSFQQTSQDVIAQVPIVQQQISTAQTQMSTDQHQMHSVQPQMPSVQPQMPIIQHQKLFFQPQMPNFQTQMPKSNYSNQPLIGQSQTPLYHTFPSNQIHNFMSSQNQLASQFNGFSYPQNNLDFQSLTAQSLQEKTAQNLILTASQLQNTAAQILSQGQVSSQTQHGTAVGLQQYYTAGHGQDQNTSLQQDQTGVQPQYYPASQYQTQ